MIVQERTPFICQSLTEVDRQLQLQLL
jgi:hypothetical protein